MKSISRWLAPLLAAALAPSAVLAAGIESIEVLSGRADMVAGGDALIDVRLSAGVDPSKITMTLNGNDVTSMFAVRPNGRYAGLVTGLAEGDNELRAKLPDGTGARIKLRNHPIGGPVFSGEQIQPWLCRAQLQNPPLVLVPNDPKCNAVAPVVEHFYRNLGNTAWLVYNPMTPPDPSLVRQTTTDQGKTVPFIIQRVTGTANRGVYQIAVLVDPTKPIEPWSVDQPWNHKYVNTFGGACGTNYQQPTAGDVRDATRLGLGFAVGTSGLNTYLNSCSDVTSAEALMMTKEIVIERWGPILYTIGDGGSAGTMQQHMISGAYPGLLNGLMTSLLYEDHWYQVVDSHDCLLLSKYFGLGGAPAGWGGGGNPLFNTPALRQLVYGTNPMAPDAKCSTKIGFTAVELIAANTGGCAGPAGSAWRWPNDPLGARCTIQDYVKYIFGVGPDNKAPRPIDNIGVQYGLANLLNGTLTKDRFVDVNWRIGGMDIDGVWQPQRTQADLGALATLYRTGRIADGSGAAHVAEIDLRNNPTDTGFHPPFHSWSWRARIDRTLGNHDNSVIWVPRGGTPPNQFDSMRAWLDAVYSDTSADPLPAKIARNKPATVVDGCYASAANGGRQDDLFCTGIPGSEWQYFSNMRWVAGWPMTLDTFKCQLKPLNRLDYVLADGALVDFTDEEWDKLNQAFPTGVCDFSKPAVAQEPSQPWVSFAGGPGGQPLGDAPKSTGVNPPVAQCKNVTLQACSAQVDVNNGTFDPDGDSFTLAQSPAGPYSLGTTRVTLSATDALGLTGSCQADVRLVDATVPSVSPASAAPASLWPPNRRMVPVSVTVAAADNCAGNVSSSCRIVAISGNDSASSADWRITGALSASLRADRTGKAGERTYALTVECTDPSGNAARQVATVVVPHNASGEE